ncbi:alpha/beta fold hydrolase [Microbacterium sp. bgisy207]|jgi:pimeloyl-ACP methyl ester carboxylesterase|uniref:alpha/beta fold hydrolase n=1 Tax=Microbacterium sp. bgisy207 TaxID=3413800 RepID=UPI003EB846B6
MADTETFEPDGRAIPYADDRRDGPSLVLVPGEGLNIAYLGPLAEALTEEDFRVVRIGARRPEPGASVTMRELAQDVVDVMDHLGLECPWVGGHGFGGTVARSVAIDHPTRAAGLLLLGVETGVDASPATSEIPASARNTQLVAMQRTARAEWSRTEGIPLPPAIPILVIQGAMDEVMPPANAEALRATAPERVSVVTIDGARDLFPLTHVGETAWPIEDYLDWD